MKKTPINLKYRKYFRTKLSNKSLITLKKADFIFKVGLQCFDQFKLTPSQIETTRVAIRRLSKRKKRIWSYWVKLFPYCPVSKKSVGMRMGKGKGSVKRWVCPVAKGQILYEINSPYHHYIRYFKAYSRAWRKLPFYAELVLNKY